MKRKPTIKDFKKASKVGDLFDVRISFAYTGDGSEAGVHEREITIDLEECPNTDYFWSFIFHELGHIWCWDNDKYHTYHADDLSPKEMGKYIRKNGLRIERYVDKIGRRLGKESGIKFTYKPAYKSKHDVDWYRQWIEREYPL